MRAGCFAFEVRRLRRKVVLNSESVFAGAGSDTDRTTCRAQ